MNRSTRTSVALGLAILVLAAAGTANARPAAASCALATAAIHHTLGIIVMHPTQQVGHGSLLCSYSVNSVPDAVKVIFKTGVTLAAFHATRASFFRSYPHAHETRGLGDAGFYAIQGSGPYGSTILFVHHHTSEVDVTAISSLAKCERLASALLNHV